MWNSQSTGVRATSKTPIESRLRSRGVQMDIPNAGNERIYESDRVIRNREHVHERHHYIVAMTAEAIDERGSRELSRCRNDDYLF